MHQRPDKRAQLIAYSTLLEPGRLAVGDIVQCPDFERGFKGTDGIISVAWPQDSKTHRDYLAKTGRGAYADDATRVHAKFLIVQINLEQEDGPEDCYPGEHRLCRRIQAVRLSDDLIIQEEKITFALDGGMCVTQPESIIKVLGYAKLPVVWQDEDVG